MTREEIRDRILLALNESTSSPTFFSLAEIDDIIDEANEIISEEVSQIRRTVYLPKRRGTFLYNLLDFAPDIMSIYRVWIPQDERRLEYISMRRLDLLRQRWMEVTSDSVDFWYPVSWDTFGIFPGATKTEGWIQVDYLAWHPALIDDGDEPEFDEHIHDATVLYGVYDGFMKQWDIVRAMDYFTQFVQLWQDQAFAKETDRFSRNILSRETVRGDIPETIRSVP